MPQFNRQLAAIMFTDIVGYTALMDKDEDAAFAMLTDEKQMSNPFIVRMGVLQAWF